MIFYYFSQSPKVTRHAVGKTTAFGILQEENEKEYSYECVWSERKECNNNQNIHIRHGLAPIIFFL